MCNRGERRQWQMGRRGRGEAALTLLERIELEGACVGASTYRMSKRQFIAWQSVDWQRHGYKIFAEWRRLILAKRH